MKKHIIGALVVLAGLSACSHKPNCCGPLAPPPLPLPDAPDTQKQRLSLSSAIVDTVHFATDKATLSEDAKDILLRQAEWLLENPTVDISVDGHADLRASSAYNQRLGMRRAKAVRDYLVKAGVDGSRISIRSSGENEPVAGGRDSVSLSLNRRAVTSEK